MEKQKEYNLRYLLAKVRTTRGKASNRLRQRKNKRNKTVSDVFRHRSGTGKSYCRKRFDLGSERVKSGHDHFLMNTSQFFLPSHLVNGCDSA
jgi:hypothetical protein